MGPGVFYTGQTNTFEVTARSKTEAANGFPAPFEDDTLIESGCEWINSTFHCYIIRTIDGSADEPNVNLGADDTVVMHAFGDLANGGIDYHGPNYGLSDTLNVASLAPTLPAIVQAGVITVQWSPTPLFNLDV